MWAEASACYSRRAMWTWQVVLAAWVLTLLCCAVLAAGQSTAPALLYGVPDDCQGVSVSPDGSLAFVISVNVLYVIPLPQPADFVLAPYWSPGYAFFSSVQASSSSLALVLDSGSGVVWLVPIVRSGSAPAPSSISVTVENEPEIFYYYSMSLVRQLNLLYVAGQSQGLFNGKDRVNGLDLSSPSPVAVTVYLAATIRHLLSVGVSVTSGQGSEVTLFLGNKGGEVYSVQGTGLQSIPQKPTVTLYSGSSVQAPLCLVPSADGSALYILDFGDDYYPPDYSPGPGDNGAVWQLSLPAGQGVCPSSSSTTARTAATSRRTWLSALTRRRCTWPREAASTQASRASPSPELARLLHRPPRRRPRVSALYSAAWVLSAVLPTPVAWSTTMGRRAAWCLKASSTWCMRRPARCTTPCPATV